MLQAEDIATGNMKGNVVQQRQAPSCLTCRSIHLRDPSRNYYWRETPSDRIEKEEQSEAAHVGDLAIETEDDLNHDSDPEPVLWQHDVYKTLPLRVTTNIFHGTEGTVANGAETFCNLCSHWANGLLMREEWPTNEPVARIDLGNLVQLEMRSDCPACCGILQSLSRSSFSPDRNEDLALELSKSYESVRSKYKGSIVYKDVYKTSQHYAFAAFHLKATEYASFDIVAKADALPTLASSLINWERLIHWYKKSSDIIDDKPLGDQYAYNYDDQSLPPGFLLLNVAQACLVEVDVLHPPCYAALSYVWGQSDDELTTMLGNVQQFKEPGQFRNTNVPLLFQDSFQVCSQLGVDYLWIDRLCIVQDDPRGKPAQLAAMGHIYSMATFTIVSSEPDFVQQGLYGISQPRSPQVGYSLGDLLLLPPSATNHKSTWLTRGWTYQEGFLSQRLLIFGESMVQMACRGNKHDEFEGFRSYIPDKSKELCGSFDTRATGFAKQMQSYSARRLTYDTDRLNAFLGVLTGFGRQMYGVPLKVFDQAILWFPGADHDQAQDPKPQAAPMAQQFPSWSWASTSGAVDCRHNPEDWNPLYSIATWATVVSDDLAGHSIELLDAVQARDNLEAARWIEIFRNCTSGLEVMPGYTPVILAVIAHVCERYRRLQEKSTEQQQEKTLEIIRKQKEEWRQASWFEGFDKLIQQVPEAVRWETLLRVAKPTFPDFKDASDSMRSLLETAAEPGRILVHAAKATILLKYQSVFVGGNHLWKMGHEGRLIGHTEIDEYRHQELLAMKDSQDANLDTVEVDCLALSVMGVRVEYAGTRRTYKSTDSDPGCTVLVMIVRKASENGCSHRLGVGYADLQAWGSIEAMVQTTMLE